MKKRLMIGLFAAGLLAAMLPEVASADPPGNRRDGGPTFIATISCDTRDGGTYTVSSVDPIPAGEAQSTYQRGFRALLDLNGVKCAEGTEVITFERIT